MQPLPPLVAWFDPGLTTGVAMLIHGRFHRAEQWPGPQVAQNFETLLGTYSHGPVWVGWEQYIIAPGGGRAGTPGHALPVIGAIAECCRLYDTVTVLPPMPSASRKSASPALLRALGWRTRGMPHGRDASLHLAAWCEREGYLEQEMKEAWTKVLGGGTPQGEGVESPEIGEEAPDI